MEWSKSRRDHISAYVTSLKNKGVPIHGIGLQMHAHIDTGRENISAALTAAASTGLLVHISELDIEVNHSKNPNAVFTDQLAQRQKEAYKSMFEAFMAVPKDKQYGISFWGVDDAHSWLTPVPDWPLPFDKNFKKKPAYYGMTETFPE